MLEYLKTPAANAVILVTIALILSIVAWYCLAAWRDRTKDEDTVSDDLTNFREMRQRGVLEENEFRTIKTVLAEKMQDELNKDDRAS